LVAIAEPVVVRLYQPLSGEKEWAIESTTVKLLRQHSLPVPELLAARSSSEGTKYERRSRQAVVARIIGLSAHLNNTPMVDHIIVGNRGYWSAWAQSAVDW
jgi:hypothetical protein